MPDPDFGGLRTAVEDAATRAPFESLRGRAAGSAPAPRSAWPRPAWSRVAALAAVTRARAPASGPEPGFDPPRPRRPATPAQRVRPERHRWWSDTAFGRSTAYALLGECAGPRGRRATYRLLVVDRTPAGRGSTAAVAAGAAAERATASPPSCG